LVKFKKADFVSAVAVKTGMTKEQSKVALTAVLDVLAKQHQNQRVLFGPLQEEPQPLVGRGSSQSIAALHREIQILTEADVLAVGLACAGYDIKRQIKVNLKQNMTRFKQFFGPEPPTIVALFKDLRDKHSTFKYKDGLMTLNWLYLNDKQSVLGGRWGYCKEYIGPTVKKYAKMIQSLKSKKIKFIFGHNKQLKASIDCSNFITNEFCKDPSGKWYDHKSNSSGLVCFCSVCGSFVFLLPAILTDCAASSSHKKYEAALDIWAGRVVSLRGPFEAGMHDMTVFRGGKVEDGKENWNRKALYFQIKQGD
jgi:hypothetical protein